MGAKYDIIDLGVLSGATLSNARAINGAGWVAGLCDATAPTVSRGFLWQNGTMTDIGDFGGPVTEPWGVNNSGQVVGTSMTAGGDPLGFMWQSGTMTDLGSLGGTDTIAYDINGAGKIVGQSKAAGDPINYFAFLYDAGTMTDLGTLPGGTGSVARAINATDQVAGASGVAGGDLHVCLWNAGVATDLGTLGGTQGWGNAINDAGQIVGQSKLAGGNDHAFLWTAAGGMTDLGTFGGTYSSALDINHNTQIVGAADMVSGASHAFIYDADNGLRDLNDLIPADANWVLTEAVGINNAGQITGTGKHNGETRAYLLTPAEPGGCCSSFGLAAIVFLAAACYLTGLARGGARRARRQ